ncbi:class I lanthipeptide [Chitinophaga sp. HK235]|uniref:class I lanthipeptide n=1 Tax=Chitinophaga sp. HK235 TaxID=2952571 RepID=UPI001BA9A114|nr:class I lanthipeptide [Chitinophaga sp. HK235]
MRKKKISLDKKLSLNKSTIVTLNAQQQAVVEGGAIPVTRFITCLSCGETCDICVTLTPQCI